MCKHSIITALLLIAVTCAFANWTGEIKEPELRTKIEGKEFYLISSPEELAWFAAQVNSGKTEINGQLANDIVLWEDSLISSSEATNWVPIGDCLTKSFNGIFDGKNHIIRGLYIHEERKITNVYRSDSICIGLFGSLDYNGVVKNLNIENAYFNINFTPKASTDESMSKNSANIGGVIGFNKGYVENILFKGAIETGGNLGGLIGRNNGHIEDVAFEGNVGSGYGKIGGIVGYNSGSIKKAIASGKIQSKLSPSSSYESYIGGIAGYVENGLIIENCENNIDIADSTSRIYDKYSSGYVNVGAHTYVGGIAGYINAAVSVINSTNNGSLQANLVGGIAGFVRSTTIDNCKNEGTILGRTDWFSESSGGIIGSGKSVQILNNVNNALISSVYQAAGIAGDLDSNSTIDNCINNGIVKAPRAAGIVVNGRSLVKNSINNDSIVGGTSAAGKTADFMSKTSEAYGIGTARVLENCTNYGAVFASYSNAYGGGGSRVMGIGYAELIEKSTNNGTVISKGEFTSKNISACNNASHTIMSSGIGEGGINNCTNNGNVAAYIVLNAIKNVDHVCNVDVKAGGIAASLGQSINKSVNKGLVEAYSKYSHNENKINYGVGNSFVYAGGLVGKASGSIKITDSYNLGSVNASNYVTISGSNSYDNRIWVGGIAGYVGGTGETFIRNVYSAADSVTSLGSSINYSYSGALFGQMYREKNKTVLTNNAYYDLKIKNISVPIADAGSTDTINVGGLSTTDMQSDQFAWILNTTAGTQDHSRLWSRKDRYPIFADDEILPIYKVTFDDDGATNIYRYTYEYSNNKGFTSVPKNQAPVEGYKFVSWVKENGDVFDGKQIVSEDIMVSALYAPIVWTINFYNAAPADTVLETKSYQHGSIVTYGGVEPTLTSTSKYSYTFKGWDVDPTNAVEDFNYHALYDSTIRSYAIEFNNFDGSKIESTMFEYGKMPICSKIPNRAATVEWQYTHKGWKPALDFVTEGASYTAIYDSSKVEYKVTFMNGTEIIDEQMVPYGGAAVAPTNVTRDGYKFVGWSTTFSKVTESLTVKALFEELIYYTVNVVNENGEKIDEQKIEDGQKCTLPEAPKKDGYTFNGWFDGEGELVGNSGDKVTITENLTFKAKYTVISYVITFADEDGSEISSAKVAYGNMPTPPEDPTKASTAQYTYAFAGWDKEITKATGATTYTATYSATIRSYTITFVNEDGSEISSTKVAYGKLPTTPEDPTKTSTAQYTYAFAGWDKEIVNVTDAATYTATYNKFVRKYIVTFLDFDGSVLDEQSVAYGNSAESPEKPVRKGYKFIGWDSDFSNIVSAVDVIALYEELSSSSSAMVSSSSTAKSSSSKKDLSSSSAKSSSSEKGQNVFVANNIPVFNVFVVERNVQIVNAKVGSTLIVFDMQGRIILTQTVNAVNFAISLPQAGRYIIRVDQAYKVVHVK